VRIYQSLCKLPVLVSALSEVVGANAQLLTDLFITPLKVGGYPFCVFKLRDF